MRLRPSPSDTGAWPTRHIPQPASNFLRFLWLCRAQHRQLANSSNIDKITSSRSRRVRFTNIPLARTTIFPAGHPSSSSFRVINATVFCGEREGKANSPCSPMHFQCLCLLYNSVSNQTQSQRVPPSVAHFYQSGIVTASAAMPNELAQHVVVLTLHAHGACI